MTSTKECSKVAQDLVARTFTSLTKEQAALRAVQEQERRLDEEFKALAGEEDDDDRWALQEKRVLLQRLRQSVEDKVQTLERHHALAKAALLASQTNAEEGEEGGIVDIQEEYDEALHGPIRQRAFLEATSGGNKASAADSTRGSAAQGSGSKPSPSGAGLRRGFFGSAKPAPKTQGGSLPGTGPSPGTQPTTGAPMANSRDATGDRPGVASGTVCIGDPKDIGLAETPSKGVGKARQAGTPCGSLASRDPAAFIGGAGCLDRVADGDHGGEWSAGVRTGGAEVKIAAGPSGGAPRALGDPTSDAGDEPKRVSRFKQERLQRRGAG
eukprot:jgi/Botrbrau1/2271/Bobra.101_2s0094.1